MANYIPFDELEIGKTYFLQSRYWHEVLGRATVTSLDLLSGRGEVETDWNPNESGHGNCVFEADWNWMWDEMPTKEEQRKRVEEAWHEKYMPPRELEGVRYRGSGIPDDWEVKLDDLIWKVTDTITKDKRFKPDKNGDGSFIWESKLNYPVSALLIRGNGECDWDSIHYIEKHSSFVVKAGERDSFGWLTGMIFDPWSKRKILYG